MRRLCQSVAMAAVVAGSVLAGDSAMAQWSLFGDAKAVKGGKKGAEKWATELTSLPSGTYSGIAFEPSESVTFEELSYLGTEYNANEVGGGSPRFSIGLDEDGDGEADGNVFVYVGDYPNFDGPAGYNDTGNLLDSDDLRFDTSQIGGTFYDDYAGAAALAGDATITYVLLVVDAGWATEDGQTVVVDNVTVGIDGKNFVYSEKGKKLGHSKK